MLSKYFDRDRRPEINRELEPYTNMAADAEVEQRLDAMQQDLELSNRNLLTSNDRYQASACYLSLARNKHILMATIAGRVTTEDGNKELRSEPHKKQTIIQFMTQGFQSSRDSLEFVDEIEGQPGFKFNDGHMQGIRTVASLQWPPAEQMPKQAIIGIAEAADIITAHVATQFGELTKSNSVPNDFRMALRKQVDPLLAQVNAKAKAIERSTGGMLDRIDSAAILKGIYDDAKQAIIKLDEITVWATAPKLYDRRFELRNPLDEVNPNKKSFDASALGGPVVRQHTHLYITPNPVPAAPPKPKARPFNAAALQAATPLTPPIETRVTRPFNPSILSTPPTPKAPVSQKTAGRQFSLDSLAPKPPKASPPKPVRREFSNEDLGPAQPPKPARKTFDPEHLNKN